MNLQITVSFEQDAFVASSVNEQHFVELVVLMLRQSAVLC